MPITDNKLLLRQIYQKIDEAMNNERFADAHRLCLQILRFDPENLKVIRLKNKIEKVVRKYNRKAIEKDIQQLEPFWKNGQYDEILNHLKQLEPYLSDYPPLKKIILKAQSLYNERFRKEKEQSYEESYQKIQILVQAKKYQEALREAEKLRILQIHEKQVMQLISALKRDWIESEISANEVLLKSDKYEDILLFLQYLQKIDLQSLRLKNMIENTKKAYKYYKIEAKRDFIYNSLEQIRILYQLKKYERTVDAIKEVLEIDPENKSARSFLRKAQRKVASLIKREMIQQILNNRKQLMLQYRSDKKGFRRI